MKFGVKGIEAVTFRALLPNQLKSALFGINLSILFTVATFPNT